MSVRYLPKAQDHGLRSLSGYDRSCLLFASQRLSARSMCMPFCQSTNVNRVVGTIVGSEVTRRYGVDGLPARYDSSSL